MAPSNSIQLIDAALSSNTRTLTLSSSYEEPNRKWIIREHLISLLQEFESLVPSIESFTYNDGTTDNLLNVNGFLQVSTSTSPIPITIWIHENYPNSPPLVFLSLTNQNHPLVLVDSYGSITTPYFKTWTYPQSNLLDLVRDIVYIISHHQHTSFSIPDSISNNDPSKLEALDHLVAMLQSDVAVLQTKTEEDIDALSGLQAELVDRADILTAILIGVEHERSSLKQRVMEITEAADIVMNWLRVHDPKSIIEVATFEAEDEISEKVIESLAGDEAIEDVLYALDKAMVEGVVSLGEYLKQIRILSREQFFYRAMLVNLRSSNYTFHS